MDIFLGIINNIIQIISYIWWLICPIILFPLFWNLRMIYLRTRFINSLEWTILEIKIPENILRTPKAMELVFTAIAASYSFGMKPPDIYAKGKVEAWTSFEMVGYSGGVHFYIYALSKYRNLIESAIYAQYPEAEIQQAEDYTELLGSNLPNKIYDIFGTGMVLIEDSYYPLKTYQFFEEMQEEKRLDPVAAISEVMSGLKQGEMIWLQFLICPTGALTGNDWQKQGQEKINEITGKKTEKDKKKGLGNTLNEWIRNLFFAPIKYPDWLGPKKEEPAPLKFLNPHEQEMVKAISNKISKFGFETVIRFVYLDRRDSFTQLNVAAIFGSFQQYGLAHLNSFKPDGTLTAKSGWPAHFFPKYKEWIELFRKRRLFDFYRQRRFGKYNKTRPEKFPVLSVEELATIYHFPTIMVKAPKLRKIESKKGGPPAGLPVE